MSDAVLPARLHRDAATYALYLSFATWGWFLYSFNPSVPLLRDELGVPDWAAGLHGTASAVGSLIAGLVLQRLVARSGRRTALRAGAGLLVAGVSALLVGHTLAVTLPAMAVLSFGGTVLVCVCTVSLAQRHHAWAPTVLSEANGVGTGVGLVGPLAVGVTVAAGWTWRPAVAVVVPLAVLVAVLTGRAVPDAQEADALDVRSRDAAPPDVLVASPSGRGGASGDPALRAFLVCVVAGVAMEFATTFWGTALVREQTGSSASVSAAVTSGFLAGMTASRWSMGVVTGRVRTATVLVGAFGATVLGWLVLWTTGVVGIAVAGLVVLGLGVGATYPLAVAEVIRLAGPGRGDWAQGIVTVASSGAIAVAPFALGAVADLSDTHVAFLLLPLLGVAGATAAWAGGRRRAPAPALG